ncbi:MAG TPA: hypothetical protein ENH40_02590 [Nitrospirae bacterium]|nr:hypothetical protein [Nitrospirota bacterium]
MKLKKIKWKDIFCLFFLSVMVGCGGDGGSGSSQQGTGGGDGSVPANELSSFGIHGAYSPAPYFQQEMEFTDDEYLAWVSGHMRTINARFTRRNTLLIWDEVVPDINNPDNYDWDARGTDKTLVNIYKAGNDIHALIGFDTGQQPGQRDPLEYPDEFRKFVQDVVERYDGDGTGDVEADSPVRVKYWQAGNEWPNWTLSGHTQQEYVQYFELIEEGAHAADPDAGIVLISHMPASSLDEWWEPTVLALKGKIDAVDLHEWGDAPDWKMTHVEEARAFLDANGMSDVEIWTGENATHTGQPDTPALRLYQTLAEQARFLVKRICWSRANGLSRFFWSLMMDRYEFMGEPDSFFNSIGMIGDGEQNNEPIPEGVTDGFNARRNIYWAYKLLAEKTDSTVAVQIGEMSLTDENANRWGYEYRLKADSRRVFVLWTEGVRQDLTFSVTVDSVHVIDMIDVNESGIFANEYDVNAVGSEITVSVGENPLMVIEN